MQNDQEHTDIELTLLKKVSSEFGINIKIDTNYQFIKTGSDYHVSFYMVGERILFTFPSGDSSNLDMQSYYNKRNEFLDLYGPKDQKFVEIRNYSDINGFPDKKSRLIQTENLIKDNKRLYAFIILSAPMHVKLVFKVGMKVNKTEFPVFFFNNYSSAIKKANDIVINNIHCKLSIDMLVEMKEYELSMPYFETKFSIIPKRLIYLKGKGSPDLKETQAFCDAERALYNANFDKEYPIYRISDYSEMKSSGLNQRVIYAKHLRKLYKKSKLIKKTIVVGANPYVKNSISMLKSLFSINVIFVETLEEAFIKINQLEENRQSSLNAVKSIKNRNEFINKTELNKSIDELLNHMGSMTWDKPTDSVYNIDNNHFLKPIYEALRVIENDVNNLLIERKEVEQKLQFANQKLHLDIKAREKFEQDRKRLEEQLHQSEKMQAIGQLAGGIAHDFNNQLGAIVGYADLLKRNVPDTPKLHKYIDNIKLVSKRAKDLTSQLLAFARKGKYHSTDVNMHDLIHEVSNLSKHTMDKKIIIRQELDALNSEVEGDPTQLQNVLLNLSINARDAMPTGGTITFKTENLDRYSDWFNNRSIILGPGKYFKLSVSDTGSGIPDGIRNHIFEPFFTTKKPGQGTGMGLAAVYGTVKNHHGSIDVETTPGKGTTFHILIPQKEFLIKENTQKDIKQTVEQSSGIGDTVFLIDDEEPVLETATELLQELGYTVFESQNPVEAIELYRKSFDKIDVVILDMIMPEMGGAEVYEELKKINNNIKVIITSGYSIEHEQRLINENKNVHFIQKPYDIEMLNAMINRVIHKS